MPNSEQCELSDAMFACSFVLPRVHNTSFIRFVDTSRSKCRDFTITRCIYISTSPHNTMFGCEMRTNRIYQHFATHMPPTQPCFMHMQIPPRQLHIFCVGLWQTYKISPPKWWGRKQSQYVNDCVRCADALVWKLGHTHGTAAWHTIDVNCAYARCSNRILLSEHQFWIYNIQRRCTRTPTIRQSMTHRQHSSPSRTSHRSIFQYA